MLGPSFRWLWASSASTNLADGVLLAAFPLLVAGLSADPLAVAAAVVLQQLPWLLLGVLAGAVVDRVERRRLLVVVTVLRALVLGALVATLLTDVVSLPVVLVAAFLLGTAETFADNASSTLVPAYVAREHLGRANSRLHGTRVLTNQLAGPPLGAALFGLGLAVPFGATVVLLVAGAVLVARCRPVPVAPRAGPGAQLPPVVAVRRDVAEGLRWLWAHPPVRTLAVTITLFNVTFGAGTAVYVLYATEVLGLGETGYGLLLTAGAVGGLVGATAYGWLERRVRLATLMRVGLVVETLTHLSLVLTRSGWVAGATMALFGVHAVVWGTTSTTVRQRATPSALLGRVTSVYMLGGVGGMVLGGVVGGLLARQLGLLAPLWFAFAGSLVLTAVLWPTFDRIVHAAEQGPEGEGSDEEPAEGEQAPPA